MHIDVCHPISVVASSGLSIFKIDSSRYLYLLRHKYGSFEMFQNIFQNEVELIVTKIMFVQLDCRKNLSYKFSECLMSYEKNFIACTSENITKSRMF